MVMNGRIKLWVALVICAGFVVSGGMVAGADATGSGYRVVKTLAIGGEGRWDCVTIDPATKMLYVPRSTHTQIINVETGKVVGDLKDTPGVHGVAIVPEVNRGFTSNGRGNSVTIFDLKTNEALGTIAVGENPDVIIFDPESKMVVSFNGKSKDASVIDINAAP